MNKIKFQLISILRKVRGSVSIILTAALVILVIFEVLVIKRAVTTVLDIAHGKPQVVTSQLVRINFTAYDKVVDRIQGAPSFTPAITITSNPFGINTSNQKK